MKIDDDFKAFTNVAPATDSLNLQENVPLSQLTTIRLGGEARFVIPVEEVAGIKQVYEFADQKKLPVWIMGGGANTIAKDAGYEGIVLLNQIRGIEILAEDDSHLVVRSGAGEVWDDLVQFTTDRNCSGIEAMSKIPGTVGATPVQNIGAYGQDVAQVLKAIYAFDTISREFVLIKEFANLSMNYRNTYFNHGDGRKYIILAVVLELKKTELKPPFYTSLENYVKEHEISDFSPSSIRRMVSEIRAQKLPDPAVQASAGSFFKNIILDKNEIEKAKQQGIPVWQNNDGTGKINSGWLIEKCGLKGQEFYGFRVSDKAALVLINESATSYADLNLARQKIIDTVREKFGFTLEQEPVEMPIRPNYDLKQGLMTNYQEGGEA